MAFPLALIPAIASLASTVAGGVKESKQRKEMSRTRNQWSAENEALYNREYYGDYMQRADVQNVIRQMRNEMDKQSKAEQNSQAVLGTTAEVSAANKERRNKAMADLYGNLSASGQSRKDRVQDRYLSRRYGLQGLEYDTMGQSAQSANNLMYNGIKGLAGSDWSGIMNFNGGASSGGSTGTTYGSNRIHPAEK